MSSPSLSSAATTEHPLVMLGCGKMGGAMLSAWIAAGLPPAAVHVIDPNPSDQVRALAGDGLVIGAAPEAATAVVLAVKPQMMADALPAVAHLQSATFISIAGGTTLAWLESQLGPRAPVVRLMPNTPAAVRKGVSALVASAAAGQASRDLAENLARAAGAAVWLPDESLIDAVTAVSGSGPAYVFHLIEALAAAAQAQGLPPELAMTLARATIIGAGALAEAAPEDAATLRRNVTSPGGVTKAALEVLAGDPGLTDLMTRSVAAGTARSRELGG